ncbi:MAG: glycoside hydrolase family 3 protein [Pseudomonadota bacterium]
MVARAAIFGCEGLTLGAEERAFFAKSDPWGFILFARNLDTAGQIKALTCDLRDAVGRDAPILIDQEGGRVDRFTREILTRFPPALDHADRHADTTAAAHVMSLRAALTAVELAELGIDVNCTPVLDIARTDTHPVIANRCLGRDADRVSALGRAMADAMLAQGSLPVIKHMPGHGRSALDTHHDLPTIEAPLEELERTDFAPFRALNDLPMGMTGHLLIPALDGDHCATLSSKVVDYVRTKIGFQGLVMTDDFSMGALSGALGARTQAALSAGCDLILHCNGQRAEMEVVADHAGHLSDAAQDRAARALALRHAPVATAADLRAQLLAQEAQIHAA